MDKPVSSKGMRLLHHPATAWVVLLCSLILTIAAWHVSNAFVRELARDRFRFHAQDVRTSIARRMQAYEAVLRSGVGLFQSSAEVSRAEWRAFVATTAIDRYYPGIQGIGYSAVVRPEERHSHTEAIRAEGFPGYSIRPQGERDVYTSIIYLEPFIGRNLRAFGYDIFSEPVRRAAMERARDSGEAALSGKVTLVQETDSDIQPGFLLYLPVYRPGMPIDTVEQRRAAIRGFVYSPFRVRDLMAGILGAGMGKLDFEIHDGEAPSQDSLIFDSDQDQLCQFGKHAPELSETSVVRNGGHAWTLYLYARGNYISAGEAQQSMVIAAGGLTINILLFAIIVSIARQRQRAERLALDMTAELRRSQDILAEKAGALERSNTDLEQFAYVTSHDLREPLRMISSYLTLLERRLEGSLDGECREFIGFARDGAQRLDHLILDLLQYSRIGRAPDPPAPVDLGEVAAEAVGNLGPAIEETRGRVDVAALPRVVGNRSELVRLFQNLIGNALKYHAPDRAPVVGVSAERDGAFWRLAVTDNGLGIDEKYFGRIFGIFQRLHARGTFEGNGIGLSVCKKIVEHHQGRIWVESRPGEGSTFLFTLPVTP
ncbi:CHASE domain-containing protein [Magnetospirillum sp. SS-4]|uniref:CHASE domain-containing protein n=1 Tax=Magnetospirillum sp. SS-4 TaxID=2681465 RepID=UPI00137DC8E8|nr:CHASE domain-containing protein [Magnetospirillum sp. SS-4]CAA7626382.1 Signal transduction histidine kinase [Magnetospirillum sp. SS-4]